MSDNVLQDALERMRRHYGPPATPPQSGRWETLLSVVLTAGLSPAQQERLTVEVAHLDSPGEVADTEAAVLAERLAGVPRGRQKAAVLQKLAGWWRTRFGNRTEADWGRDRDALRDSLRQLRGVSLELADRLLLGVGGLPVVPLDRATIRIACRHGWCGLEQEYDDWQGRFVPSLPSTAELQEFSQLADRIGRDFCGTVPHCEACPLKALLPAGGPYESDRDL